ncbi:MAG: hydroxylamine reductase [Deltaproteobacteria bacterium]
MFCTQCEQTSKGGCVKIGVCGKDESIASLQDLLLFSLKGLSFYAVAAREAGIKDPVVDHFVMEAIFTTLTNVNFDPESLRLYILKTISLRELISENLRRSGNDARFSDISANYQGGSLDDMIRDGQRVGLPVDAKAPEDIRSLQHILLYGIKGVAAYAHHAIVFGQEDEKIYDFIYKSLAALGTRSDDVDFWLGRVLGCGEINLRAMELLDEGNTFAFGHPAPSNVSLGHKTGKCILVSGHDLKDLKALLEATEGRDISIYTHGEMLPAHGYPELNVYPHLVGHYGTAWQNQQKEFADFPGPVLMTTNCLMPPKDAYQKNVFTAGPVGYPGLTHLEKGNYEPLIQMALQMPGFSEDSHQGSVMVGFARNSVLGVADKIVEGVKAGAIKHFFLVGGCDGAKSGRNYFTELVEKTPSDTVVLTLGCGKYRFFDKQLGAIDGIPRLLDVGQCNDSYSAIQIAVALANAFECSVNELPLSMILSWYEQKAVAVLLTLLFLGIKNIRLGPTLPAFITPGVLDVLVKNFDIKPITTADEDLRAILG